MKSYSFRLAALLPALLFAGCAIRTETRTVYVAPVGRLVVAQDSGATFQTISAALDSARDGDTVFVMPGEYREVVKIVKLRHITLLGASPAATAIDAGDEYSAIELRTDSNRISGLTIRGADSHGIWVRDGQQFIDHCLIVGNGDRGIYLSSMAGRAFAAITHCTVTDNGEVGIHAARDDSNTVITDCIITFNPRGVVTDQPEGNIVLRRNCMFGNGIDFDRVAPGDSNIVDDPRFIDRQNGDFRLKKGSHCIGAGSGGTNLGAF
ncbi:MAG: right-handed parallel beta-helix repeat-containing protein [candidate division WOR-3 bacterium]|nr:right-handed parallel beta-helix repeat-containing protein [candidate division WOR-3 bacterium]